VQTLILMPTLQQNALISTADCSDWQNRTALICYDDGTNFYANGADF